MLDTVSNTLNSDALGNLDVLDTVSNTLNSDALGNLDVLDTVSNTLNSDALRSLDVLDTVSNTLNGDALGNLDVLDTVYKTLDSDALGNLDVLDTVSNILDSDALGNLDPLNTVSDVLNDVLENTGFSNVIPDVGNLKTLGEVSTTESKEECNGVNSEVSEDEAQIFVHEHNRFRKDKSTHPASDMVALVSCLFIHSIRLIYQDKLELITF